MTAAVTSRDPHISPTGVVSGGDAYRDAEAMVRGLITEKGFGPRDAGRPLAVRAVDLASLAADLHRLGENADDAARRLLFDGQDVTAVLPVDEEQLPPIELAGKTGLHGSDLRDLGWAR